MVMEIDVKHVLRVIGPTLTWNVHLSSYSAFLPSSFPSYFFSFYVFTLACLTAFSSPQFSTAPSSQWLTASIRQLSQAYSVGGRPLSGGCHLLPVFHGCISLNTLPPLDRLRCLRGSYHQYEDVEFLVLSH